MLIGVPKETKNHEYRVGLTPESVKELVNKGHKVYIENNAGKGAGLDNAKYAMAGGQLVDNVDHIFQNCDLIVKVKEPSAEEIKKLHRGQTLFTYLHLAPDIEQTDGLLASKVTAIAYETVTSPTGGLPLLTPMSEIAGRFAPQVGARYLEKANGGSGVLLGGVPGVSPGKVTIIGAGVSGTNAAIIAHGMGASVTIFDKNIDALKRVANLLPAIKTLYSTQDAIEEALFETDLLIGAVLIPGAAAPKVVSRDMLENMAEGSVAVDIAIDQGGCFETSRPTSHSDPVYVEEGITHYCVTNMPGAVARTSTFALNNVTLPFVMQIADLHWDIACGRNPHLRAGLNVHDGELYCKAVVDAQPGRRLDNRF